jgi:hypothetical protein
MFWMLAGEIITLGVNWWATHSGGPLHGEIFGPPFAAAIHVLQASDAEAAIVLSMKFCIRQRRGGRVNLRT